jgi:hypothetical protein
VSRADRKKKLGKSRKEKLENFENLFAGDILR